MANPAAADPDPCDGYWEFFYDLDDDAATGENGAECTDYQDSRCRGDKDCREAYWDWFHGRSNPGHPFEGYSRPREGHHIEVRNGQRVQVPSGSTGCGYHLNCLRQRLNSDRVTHGTPEQYPNMASFCAWNPGSPDC